MNNLVIANPERLDDQSFKITIAGKDYEYEISEDKDIDKVIAKLVRWISRGDDSFGGLYDYIKRSFQLVGEYEEPVVEDELPEEPKSILPSDGQDLDDVQSNELEFKVDLLSSSEVSVSLGEFSAVFSLAGNADNFETELRELVKDEMTLKDRIDLNTFLVKELDTDNSVDIYNLSGLVLDPNFEIVSSVEGEELTDLAVDGEHEVPDIVIGDTTDEVDVPSNDAEVVDTEGVVSDEDAEDDLEDEALNAEEDLTDDYEPSEDEESEENDSDEEDGEDSKSKKKSKKSKKSKKKSKKSKKESYDAFGNLLTEDEMFDGVIDLPVEPTEIDFTDEEVEEKFTLEDLIVSEDFLSSLRDLGLSLFKFTNKDNNLENLYFVGGINSNDGTLYTLTYQMGDSYSTLDGEFEDLSTNEYELSNIEDLTIVTNYLGKLLDLVYNRELGEDNE